MRFYFIHKLWMNQASRGNPFSITRPDAVFSAIALRLCTHFVSRLLRNRPRYVLIKKWVLTFTTSSAVKIVSSQGALPNATAILAANAGDLYGESPNLP